MQYQQKKISNSVFRAYDIRGIVPTELNEDAYYTIGRALSCRLADLGRSALFLARDGRLTSDALALALRQGLLDSGINVIDLGAVATPVMYYATSTQGIDSGLMVTGSHNPADYNGIKMVLAGKTFVQEDIDKLYALVQQGKYIQGQGKLSDFDIIPEYRDRIVKGINRPTFKGRC